MNFDDIQACVHSLCILVFWLASIVLTGCILYGIWLMPPDCLVSDRLLGKLLASSAIMLIPSGLGWVFTLE